MSRHYDTERIKQRVDLYELADRYTDLKHWAHNEWAGPCPRPGCTADTDGFHVHVDGWFKCYTCHLKHGDVIEFVQWLGLASDFRSACAWLDPYQGHSVPVSRPSRLSQRAIAKPVKRDWTDPQWQADALESVDSAIERLEDYDGKPGQHYLTLRGILPATWRTWGLGFDSAKYDPAQQKKRPAIVIPWYWDGQLCAVKYRFTDSAGRGDRFMQKRGSEQRLFGMQMLGVQRDTLIVCEGEFNALSIWQALGPTNGEPVAVVSFGAANGADSRDLSELAKGYRRVIIWADEIDDARDAMEAMPGAFGLRSVADPTRQTSEGKPLKLDANELLKTGQLSEFLLLVLNEFHT